MQTLCKKFQPKFVVMMDESAAKALSEVVSDNIEVLQGVLSPIEPVAPKIVMFFIANLQKIP
jgi:1-deoxy-D-xylulose 5-phosphate reductoisomerase